MATKYTPLGTVTEKLEGMVKTDKGNRSYADAQVGDTLRKNLTTGKIEVVKAKAVKAGTANEVIKELNAKIETLEDDLKEHKNEVERANKVIEELNAKIKTLEKPSEE